MRETNEMIQKQLSHRTIREFTEEKNTRRNIPTINGSW